VTRTSPKLRLVGVVVDKVEIQRSWLAFAGADPVAAAVMATMLVSTGFGVPACVGDRVVEWSAGVRR
jgi:hypothetical protein